MWKTLIATSIALVGFAANSIICRLALESGSMDATSFTSVRLLSGAVTLAVIHSLAGGFKVRLGQGRWGAALMLFAYAAAFSFAYHYLDAGVGALVLFAAVQATMIIADFVMGNRMNLTEWGGLLCAFSGFIVLLFPGITAPPLAGVLLMTAAGCAWGIYTLMGKVSTDNLADTTGNFVKSLPFAAGLVIVNIASLEITSYGVSLAMLSGGLTTGVVYVVWYVALQGLTIVQGAVVQLLVPVIAAFGGVLFLSEVISIRLVVSAAMILGGVLAVILIKKKSDKL